MWKFLKYLGLFLLVLMLGLFLFGWSKHEAKPEGVAGPAADSLARQMERAVDKAAWDSTHIIQFTFKGVHDFLWDRERNLVQVRWGKNEVLLNLDNRQGTARVDGDLVSGKKQAKMLDKAWSFFCNDTFWLNAMVKAFDPGTERSLVTLKDGREGLMVSYTSGGVTPGDSYVWLLDENGRPTAWKMWVKIIPIGGLEFSWEAWEQLPTGAWVATLRKNPLLNLDMTNLKAATSLEAFGFSEDPFAGL